MWVAFGWLIVGMYRIDITSSTYFIPSSIPILITIFLSSSTTFPLFLVSIPHAFLSILSPFLPYCVSHHLSLLNFVLSMSLCCYWIFSLFLLTLLSFSSFSSLSLHLCYHHLPRSPSPGCARTFPLSSAATRWMSRTAK